MTAVLRLIYVVEAYRSSPFFNNPVVDAEAYFKAAEYIIATGDWVGSGSSRGLHGDTEALQAERALWVQRPYWQPPFYYYFIALMFLLFGVSIWTIVIVQILLSAVSCILLYSIATHYFSHRVAFISGIVYSLYGTLIFFCGELLVPTLFIFLILGVFYLLLSVLESDNVKQWLLLGLFWSMGIVTRPTLIVFLPLVLFWMIYRKFRLKDLDTSVSRIFILIITCSVLPFGTFLRNSKVGGEKVVVSTNTGINFHIGNNDNWMETYKLRPCHRWNVLVREPLRANQTWNLPFSEQDYYFLNKTVLWILQNPVNFFATQLQKAYLQFHGYELIRNIDIYHVSRYSLILSVLLWHVPFMNFPFGLISPLFLLSFCFLLGRDRKRYFLLISFIVIMTSTIILFFPTARYRIQLVPFYIIVAIWGGGEFIRLVKHRAGKKCLCLSVIYVLFLIVLNLPRVDRFFEDPVFQSHDYFLEGYIYFKQNDIDRAVELFKKAIDINPAHEYALSALGLCYARMRKYSESERYLQAAYRESPDFTNNIYNLGIYYQETGQWGKALDAFEELVRKEQLQKLDFNLYQIGLQELKRCRMHLSRQDAFDEE